MFALFDYFSLVELVVLVFGLKCLMVVAGAEVAGIIATSVIVMLVEGSLLFCIYLFSNNYTT